MACSNGVTVRAASSVLVGRQPEMAALRDALGRARAGEPTTVLVGGEAGVGKTRLLEEFAGWATDGAARVLVGQCLELGEAGLPFAPFAAALRGGAAPRRPERLRRLRAGVRPAAAGAGPASAALAAPAPSRSATPRAATCSTWSPSCSSGSPTPARWC